MKITKENLAKGKSTKNNTLRIGSNVYYFKKCISCKNFYLGSKNSIFCSYQCSNNDEYKRKINSERISGTNNYFYGKKQPDKIIKNSRKKSVKTMKKNMLSKWFERLSWCNNIFIDNNILIAKCDYCGKLFELTTKQLKDRHININIKGLDNSRFYCSTECKQECPIFNKSAVMLIKEDGVNSGRLTKEYNREVQPELRQLVFERDNYTCQKCKQYGGCLHCHHLDPVSQNPIESADVDNCVTLCKNCHQNIHKKLGYIYCSKERINEIRTARKI